MAESSLTNRETETQSYTVTQIPTVPQGHAAQYLKSRHVFMSQTELISDRTPRGSKQASRHSYK